MSTKVPALVEASGEFVLCDGTVVLADLSRCEPAAVMSELPEAGKWRILDYSTQAYQGKMLTSGQQTAAPAVTLRLPPLGWCAIEIGLLAPSGKRGRALVRFADEPWWTHLKQPGFTATSGTVPQRLIHDMRWRTADVTGRRLVFQQFCSPTANEEETGHGFCEPAWIAYVKLKPISAEEAQAVQAERAGGQHRRLWAHNDAWCFTGLIGPRDRHDIEAELEPLRDGDFERIYWEVGGGDRMYFFKTSSQHTPDRDLRFDLSRPMERAAGIAWAHLKAREIDPLEVACTHCHSIGLELHATWRPGGFKFQPPCDVWTLGGLFDQHPQWRCVDRQGRRQGRLSFAFPQVRDVAIHHLIEAAQYPIDGVCIAYNRRLPLVEYEQPLLDAFTAQHGLDARTLDALDPRWLQFRCGVLTEFMTELRRALDAVRPGLKITAITMATRAENLSYSLDLQSWVRQGLVDALIPYSSQENDTCSTYSTWDNPVDVQWLLDLVRDTPVQVAPNLLPRHAPASSYLQRAAGLYQRNVDHLFLWDTNHRYGCTPSWSAIRRLGHREEVLDRVASRQMPDEKPASVIMTLEDWDLGMMCPG